MVKRKIADRNANNLFCIMNLSLRVVIVCKVAMNSIYNYRIYILDIALFLQSLELHDKVAY